MNSGSTVGLAGATLRAVGVAAALACGAGASLAADDATLNITSFTVSAGDFSGNFVWTTDAYQSLTTSALEAGGLYGSSSDGYSANDWNLGLNRLAQTPNATAAGNTVQFTDAMTQLTTAGFNLSALSTVGSYPTGSLPNSASASALQSGSFVLIDGDGNFAAGTITFDLYYDLSVASASNYSQSVLNLLSSTDNGGSASFDDGLLSTSLVSGAGSTSGHFTWTYALAAGEAAYYTLSGSAVSVAAIPEPSTYALMALGLAGIGVLSRRRRVTVA